MPLPPDSKIIHENYQRLHKIMYNVVTKGTSYMTLMTDNYLGLSQIYKGLSSARADSSSVPPIYWWIQTPLGPGQ